MTPRVIVADATPFLRLAVRSSLEADDIEVVGEHGGADHALAGALELLPDVVLIDADLDPEMRAVRAMVSGVPGVSVIVLASRNSQTAALAAVRAGACGFVPKDTAPERLPAIVRGVVEGEAAIPRRLMRRLLGELCRTQGVAGRDDPSAALSAREREVLDLLSRGAGDRAVAERLDISEVTVRRHAGSAARKLGAVDREEALARYREIAAGDVAAAPIA